MKKQAVVLVGILLLSCSSSNRGVKETAYHQNTEVVNIALLKEDLRKNPKNHEIYFKLGIAYSEIDSTNLAFAHYDSALANNPSYLIAKIERADLLIKKNRIKEGYTEFLEVLKKDKHDEYAFEIAKRIGQPYPILQLTSGSYNNAYGYYSPGGSRIVFQSDRDGNWEIYLMDSKGLQNVRLTNNTAQDEMPVFSPDGKSLAFTSTRNDSLHTERVEVTRNIFLMDIEGNEESCIVASSYDDWYPSFTNKEGEIVFVSERDDPRDVRFEDRWSDIYLKDIKSGIIRRLTQNEVDDGAPSVSRNGKWVIFNSNRNGSYQIYRTDKKGETFEQLTFLNGSCGAPHFSHDSKKVTFFAEVNGNYDIYVMNVDGKKLVRLTHHIAQDAYPSFSPDSKCIIFHSNRTGKFQIYSIDLMNPHTGPEVMKQLEEKIASLN